MHSWSHSSEQALVHSGPNVAARSVEHTIHGNLGRPARHMMVPDWVAGHRRVPPEAMEAAVAAARQQAEKVLEDCNARWTERANALETEARRAQCRIVELEAAAIPEVHFKAGANA